MQFESFHCLSLHGIWAIIPWSTRMASVCVIFLGLFISYCSLVFHILGAFLKITIIYSTRACWIWNDYSQRGATLAIYHLISGARSRSFDNSWYHAKTGFNNCFIIHFSQNSSSETEVKSSAILFLRRTLQGA